MIIPYFRLQVSYFFSRRGRSRQETLVKSIRRGSDEAAGINVLPLADHDLMAYRIDLRDVKAVGGGNPQPLPPR